MRAIRLRALARPALWSAASLATVAVLGAWLGRALDPTRRAGFAHLYRAPPFAVPDFRLRDTGGRTVGPDELRGQVWIAELLLLQCGTVCRVLEQRLREVSARLAQEPAVDGQVRFVGFSMAREDDAAALARYARRRLAGLRAPLTLLEADARESPRLAVAFGVARAESDAIDALPVNGRFVFLVDRGGVARGAYDALSDEDMQRLAEDARALALAGPEEPPAVRFAGVDQDGARVTEAELRGHAWVADFIFTRCSGVCPLSSARLVLLRRRVRDPSVRFVSFTVDPEHDTPEVLRAYASRWRRSDARWRLVRPSRAGLTRLAAAMKLTVAGADRALTHSDRFVLVDANGRVKGSYDSSDEAELDRLAAELTATSAAAELTATSAAAGPAAPGETLDGAALVQELGCLGCHAEDGIAAPLAELARRRRELPDGRAVPVDDAYLREAILHPAARLLPGADPTMPSYAGQLSDAQLAALVRYLRAPPAPR